MRRFLLLLCALVPCACKPQSDAAPNPHVVSRVILLRSSGPVAQRWSEQYTISRMGIEFQRAGEPGSAINAGSWAVPGAEGVPELFERLRAIDCSKIEEILPEEAPDGGGSSSYVIEYEDGGRCSTWYREGISYSGAEPLVEAIDSFIAGLTLPAEASGLFTSP